jgi:hypothetical protein
MLNILDITDAMGNDLDLENGTWQHATACDLNTSSTFWNRATLIILSKEYETAASSALVYLLQKEAKTLGLWEQEWGDSTPAISDFIKRLSVWGRFTKMAGCPISVEKFWKSYNATIEGIISQASFEYTEDGIAKPYMQHLHKKDIEQVTCFDDTWNEQNFFIETTTRWLLFSWGTMA